MPTHGSAEFASSQAFSDARLAASAGVSVVASCPQVADGIAGIRLVRDRESRERTKRRTFTVSGAPTGTLLVVEDDKELRFILRSHLEATGFDVLEAANGSEAIELATQHRPDLIIMDVGFSQPDDKKES